MWVPGSMLLSALPMNLVGWVFLKRIGLRIRPGLHTERWWALMVPSGHYALASTMSTVYHRTGHLLVRWFLGEQALGLYAAAARLVDFVRNLVSIGFVVITPRVAQSADSPNALRRPARISGAGNARGGRPVLGGL